MLTHTRLSELVRYSEEDGSLYWKDGIGGKRRQGMRFGQEDSRGYRIGTIDGVRYRQGRLVWMLFNGAMPDQEIDHINGKRDDDRIENLRQCSRAQNNRNTHSIRNSSGALGVEKRGNSYRATVWANGKIRHIGSYRTLGEAVSARELAARELHGIFASKNNGMVACCGEVVRISAMTPSQTAINTCGSERDGASVDVNRW
jgi:hypothetical protein